MYIYFQISKFSRQKFEQDTMLTQVGFWLISKSGYQVSDKVLYVGFWQIM